VRPRILVLLVLLALSTPLALWSAARGIGARQATLVTNPADFRAFYCASRVMLAGGDPYRTEPLRTCERAAARDYGLAMLDGLVLPAPLPPFALVLLAPIAALPFTVASPLWLALSVMLFSVGALLLTKLTKFPFYASVATLGGAVAYVSVPLGQVVPLVVALLCGAALALRRERFALAGALVALTAIEPHLGLPAALALFACERRTRVALAAAAAALAAVSVAALGIATCRDYLLVVLPLHALSQVDDFGIQFGLTALLRSLGATPHDALLYGGLSYAAAVAGGIAVAGALARRTRDAAFLALVPPAFAVVGGTFLHLAQVGVAIPALVLLLASGAPAGRLRALAFAALVALSIPWRSVADAPPFAAVLWPHPSPPRPVGALPAGPDTYAETTEIAFRRAGGYGSNGGSTLEELALKLPTWGALLAFAALAAGLAFRGRRKAAPS